MVEAESAMVIAPAAVVFTLTPWNVPVLDVIAM